MAIFISKKNQECLWNIFNKNNHVMNMDFEFKVNWFQQTIGVYYDKYNGNDITLKEVRNINKEFIEHIKKDLMFINEYKQEKEKEQEKMRIEQEKEQEKMRIEQEKIIKQNDYFNTNNMELKKDEVNQNLINKQKEFDELLHKKTPDEINFTESDDNEGAIKNIDELIKQRQEARDSVDKETHTMYDKYVKENKLLDKDMDKDMDKDIEIEVLEPN